MDLPPPTRRETALVNAGPARDGALTYEPYYRLTQKAFSLSPDPNFLYKSETHAPVVDDLLAAIRRREGLIILTGDIGMGKTTLCRAALHHLDRKTFSAFVPDPFMSREDLLKSLLIDFGVISVDELRSGRLHAATRLELSYVLYEFLDSLVPLQAFAVVIIDEAQNLSVPLLEEVRILSELIGRAKLLQVVLVGQLELEEKLKLRQMRQVDQRVSMRCSLTPLSELEVSKYVVHRLNVAGAGGTSVTFSTEALHAVHQISGGVPRVINLVCDRALSESWRARTDRVEADTVRNVAARLGLPVHGREQVRKIPGPSSKPAISDVVAPTPLPVEPVAPPPMGHFLSKMEIAETKRRRWSTGVLQAGLLVAAITATAGAFAWYVFEGIDSFGRPSKLALELPAVPSQAPPIQRSSSDQPPPNNSSRGDAAPAEVNPPVDQIDSLADSWGIELASFVAPSRANRLIEELRSLGINARIIERDLGADGRWLLVLADGYPSLEAAETDLDRIQQIPDYADARLIRSRRLLVKE